MNTKTIAVIAGAGPAGLTAAYELLKRTGIEPIVFEKSIDIGGISKTVNYKGNRIDIGGHRFFSKSDRVMEWWLKILPLDTGTNGSILLTYQNGSRQLLTGNYLKQEIRSANEANKAMLICNRLSRIYFLRKFFRYPLSLSLDTFKKLGIRRTLKIMASYLAARLHPRKTEVNLEDFFINRFGKELYRTFFKAYTEKVWGKECTDIPATWGRQRIKKLSIGEALRHAVEQQINQRRKNDDHSIGQKNTETSLIDRFLYPKFGPGQLWEEVAEQVTAMGGIVSLENEVVGVNLTHNRISSVTIRRKDGTTFQQPCSYFFSTMPVKHLIAQLVPSPPLIVCEIARGLEYRDFITVGLLLKDFKPQNSRNGEDVAIKDNWIYIQEKDVKVGRIQVFNNWSPFMVADTQLIWIGMEYFCNKNDEIWQLPDSALADLAIQELEQLSLAKKTDRIDSTVIRMEKAYPAYFGSFEKFDEIVKYTNLIENLFLIGRNGMHRYNNSDHSMLTAMAAVDNIVAGKTDKCNLWEVNTEEAYHEKK